MNICRLCLKNIEGTEITNPEEALELLQIFLPYMNRTLVKTPVVCEVCLDNISTADKLLNTKNESNAIIEKELKLLNVAKINLKSFHKNIYMTENFGVCRICLKIINRPKIFLCENNTNILHHDLIKKMLKYCNLSMNFEVSDKPVMCLKCWKHLQITYTFKKDYLEVERKIRIYCQDFRLRHRNLTLEALEKVRNYFSDEYCEIMTSNIKQEHGIDESIYAQVKTENISNRISHIKTENGHFIKKELYSDISTPRKQVKFTSNDNKMLISVYFEVTKNEQDFHHGYWQRLYDKWTELNPDKPVDGKRLSYQIRRIIRRKLLPKAQLEKIRAEVNSKIKAQTQPEQIVEHYSDSDDSFMEEAVHSSFTPHIKSEPLSESDVEINLIEPKLEVESDCESLPQLERMDLPPLHFKIENIYSLEVKREAYDNYLRQEEELSNMQVEELNKNRRVSLRGHNKDKDLFKCPDCSFETTHGSSAQRHMKLHQKRNQKIYQCTSCPYRIFSKWLFNRHMKKHKEEENEIPVLLPDALIPQ